MLSLICSFSQPVRLSVRSFYSMAIDVAGGPEISYGLLSGPRRYAVLIPPLAGILLRDYYALISSRHILAELPLVSSCEDVLSPLLVISKLRVFSFITLYVFFALVNLLVWYFGDFAYLLRALFWCLRTACAILLTSFRVCHFIDMAATASANDVLIVSETMPFVCWHRPTPLDRVQSYVQSPSGMQACHYIHIDVTELWIVHRERKFQNRHFRLNRD